MDIEVILLLYNRPDHARRVVESLASNRVTGFTAYLDFPADATVQANQEKILAMLSEYSELGIRIVRRDRRFGLAGSVRDALARAFTRCEAAILLEDDCVLRPGGFEFFRQGLEALRDRREIRSLCGFLFPNCDFFFDPGDDLLLLHRFCTWGWATWADRWSDYDSDLRRTLSLVKKRGLDLRAFAPDQDILCRSARYLNNEVDIWSVNWILLHYATQTFAAYPRESVISNIGMDGSGANCPADEAFHLHDEQPVSNVYNWENPHFFPENEWLIRDYMAKHALKTYPLP